jgi:hypothetical protein
VVERQGHGQPGRRGGHEGIVDRSPSPERLLL